MTTLAKLALATAALLVLSAAGAIFFSGSTSSTAETSSPTAVRYTATDDLIARLQERVRTRPDDADGLDELGFAYLQKARETADPTLYTQADGVFRESLAVRADAQQATLGLSSVALARHDFAGALTLAQQALTAGPEAPDAYGALGDALIELGRYDEAVDAFQHMVDLRPDLSSYVRVSYARELYGQVDGAIEAMNLAVEAAGPNGENAAWVRFQLGNLYYNRGDLDAAERQYESALQAFPAYAHALAARGKVAAARGDYTEAEDFYQQATERIPVVQYVVALGDVYAADDQPDQAQRQYDLVGAIDSLFAANGVRTDLEIAIYYADHGLNADEAVEHAQAVYDTEPGSIVAADALAWTLYKAGRPADALPYADQALRLGTRDANLLFHAGMINAALANTDQARDQLGQALDINPNFSPLNTEIAKQTLEELGR